MTLLKDNFTSKRGIASLYQPHFSLYHVLMTYPVERKVAPFILLYIYYILSFIVADFPYRENPYTENPYMVKT